MEKQSLLRLFESDYFNSSNALQYLYKMTDTELIMYLGVFFYKQALQGNL